MLDAIQTVLSVFMLIGVGMLLTHLNWLNEKNNKLLTDLVMRVALPGLIVNNLFTSFTRQSLLESLPGLAVPYLSIFLTLAVSLGIALITQIQKNRQGVFSCLFVFSNSVFIGVPVCTALFGDSAMPYILMYYIANTSLFWTIGAYLIQKDGGMRQEKGSLRQLPEYLMKRIRREEIDEAAYAPAKRTLNTLKRMFPIPLIAFIVCFVLVLLGARLPGFVLSAAKYMGNLTTPLSLFIVGSILMRMIRTGNFRWQKGYGWILLGRFILSPLLLIACSLLVKMPPLMRDVLIVQAAMPSMSQTAMISGSWGADSEYTTGGVLVTTALSLITIPVYMTILRGII